MCTLENKELLKLYEQLCYEIGRVASSRDINKCRYLPHSDTIRKRFGSLKNFQSLSGVIKNNELPGKPLKKTVEQNLIKARVKKGRRLDRIEIRNEKELPSVEYILRLYAGKNLKEVWEEIESKISPNIKDYLKL